jgi:hypothetical protein
MVALRMVSLKTVAERRIAGKSVVHIPFWPRSVALLAWPASSLLLCHRGICRPGFLLLSAPVFRHKFSPQVLCLLFSSISPFLDDFILHEPRIDPVRLGDTVEVLFRYKKLPRQMQRVWDSSNFFYGEIWEGPLRASAVLACRFCGPEEDGWLA